jgi:small ligand-binding sensory domain FIST
MENACSAVLMVGDFEQMTIVTHGSEPLSDARVVTNCTGNVIYEIDGRPAIDIACEGLGERITSENIISAITLMGIGFKTTYSPDFLSPYIVRAIHGFNFEDGSCFIPTEVTEGSEIQFMRRDPDSVLESARAGAEKLSTALDSLNVTPKLICQFDCAGRGKGIVGDDVHRGMTMGQEAFEPTVPWMGLFAYGEISPM